MNKPNLLNPPHENKMEELLAKIQPVPGPEFHQKMARAPWRAAKTGLVAENITPQGDKMNTTRPRRLARLGYAALVLIALFTLAFVSPQGRAFAQSILELFNRAESKERPLPLGQNRDPSFATAEPPAQFTSVAEAEKSAGFDVKELPSVPQGFEFFGAMTGGGGVSIQYQAQGNGGQLVINQSTAGFMQSEWDQAPEDAITQVKVGELDAEIVQGTFVVYAGETVAKWYPDAPILRLRWIEDGIWFEMAKFGNVESITYLDQNGLIALAESLK